MARATLAVNAGNIVGYVTVYPDGTNFVGEYDDPVDFLAAAEGLLQNGFEWTVLYATGNGPPWVGGALWWLTHKYDATFIIKTPVDASTATIQKSGHWRHGLASANRAARLLLERTEP